MEALLLLFGGVVVAIVVFVVMEKTRGRAAVYGPPADVPLPEPTAREDHLLSRDARMPIIGATDWGSVFLEATPDKAVIVLLPHTDPDAVERVVEADTRAAVTCLVVINDENHEGYLWSSTVRERLGLNSTVVYATDPSAPIDRTMSTLEKPRKANQLPKKLPKAAQTQTKRHDGRQSVR